MAAFVSWATTLSCFENQLGSTGVDAKPKVWSKKVVRLEFRRTLMLSTDVERRKTSVVVDNMTPAYTIKRGFVPWSTTIKTGRACVPESLVQLNFAGAGNRWGL